MLPFAWKLNMDKCYRNFIFHILGTVVGSVLYLKILRNRKPRLGFHCSFTPESLFCRRCLKKELKSCNSGNCALLNFSKLLVLLKSAKETIDLCIALITSEKALDALIEMHAQGVKIRVIVDYNLCKQGYSKGTSVNSLLQAGILVKQIDKSMLMHHKFVLIDQSALIIGSVNWTKSGFFGNYENVEVTFDRSAVRNFNNEFCRLWKMP